MTTQTKYFRRDNLMVGEINEWEQDGWTVKIITPILDAIYKSGAQTAGLMVTFEK